MSSTTHFLLLALASWFVNDARAHNLLLPKEHKQPLLTPGTKHLLVLDHKKRGDDGNDDADNDDETCYTANVTSWTWCGSPDAWDTDLYSCSDVGTKDEYCSVMGCKGTCDVCSLSYESAVLDPKSGRCCDSISDAGECVNPKSGQAPPNPDYGFPDHKPALIFEGAAAIENGYPVWSDDNPDGAYGFCANAPGGDTDDACPAVPDGHGLDPSLYPLSLVAHGVPAASCMLACNITEVEATGVDACSGAFNDNAGGAPYACFSGGSTWLGDASLGVCAFPCLLYNYGTGGPCTSEDMEKGDCMLSCDPREYWPNAAAFGSMNNTEA